MRSLLLLALIVPLAGCAGRGRPTLEPEQTVTHTWVGDAPPKPEVTEDPPPAAAAEDDETGTARSSPPPTPTPPPAAPGARRGWVKGGSWDR
jgi:hypothetical protein